MVNWRLKPLLDNQSPPSRTNRTEPDGEIKRLLILGGTGDAIKLASQTVNLPGLETITSLAGRTIKPGTVASATRIGGFGGEAGLVE